MSIDAIVGDIELAADIITGFSEAALAQPVPGALPAHPLTHPFPIAIGAAAALFGPGFIQQRGLARNAPAVGQRKQRSGSQRVHGVA